MLSKLKEGLLIFFIRRLALCVISNVGTVVQVDEDRNISRIRFPETKQVLIFSAGRLRAIGAAFNSAVVRHERFRLGAVEMSILSKVGRVRTEVLSEFPSDLSEEARV